MARCCLPAPRDRVAGVPADRWAVPALPGCHGSTLHGLVLSFLLSSEKCCLVALCCHTPFILTGLVPGGLRDVTSWVDGPESWPALLTAPRFLTLVCTCVLGRGQGEVSHLPWESCFSMGYQVVFTSTVTSTLTFLIHHCFLGCPGPRNCHLLWGVI